jgi:hypothetical protein
MKIGEFAMSKKFKGMQKTIEKELKAAKIKKIEITLAKIKEIVAEVPKSSNRNTTIDFRRVVSDSSTPKFFRSHRSVRMKFVGKKGDRRWRTGGTVYAPSDYASTEKHLFTSRQAVMSINANPDIIGHYLKPYGIALQKIGKDSYMAISIKGPDFPYKEPKKELKKPKKESNTQEHKQKQK